MNRWMIRDSAPILWFLEAAHATRQMAGEWDAETMVITRFFSKQYSPPTAALLLGFSGLFVLAGCNSTGYPESLTYPERADPLVIDELAGAPAPTRFDKPGEFQHMFEDPNYPLMEYKIGKNYVLAFPGTDPRTGKTGIKAENREMIAKGLEDQFGTPSKPKVKGIDKETRAALQLGKYKAKSNGETVTKDRLEEGSRLYRLHCVHCHGVPGDGRGPTAPWVNPHPRDYRQGTFKFLSTKPPDPSIPGASRKPSRDDLIRTIRQGIEGTSMPAFNLLPEEHLENLVSYVMHLSLRGEIEFNILKQLLKGDQGDPETVQIFKIRNASKKRAQVNALIKSELTRLTKNGWLLAANKDDVITPPAKYPYPYKNKDTGRLIQPADYATKDFDILKQSVQEGQKIFKDPSRGGCIKCHYDYGRRSDLAYDDWGTIIRKGADLTTGVYRGGRRPIDLYRRIHSGIPGSNMPPLLDVTGESEKDREKRIWDLVNFVQVLPYPAMREKFGIELDRPVPKATKE
jgi:mono/diheme cytochrome c family protein